jgi:three-Cys-motif partner protein
MGTRQRFGGDWTIEKLDILSSYLDFYITALKNQPFNKIYIDAFAGTGSIKVGGKEEAIEGSAKLALKAQNKFDKYIFVERNKKHAKELNQMVVDHFTDLSDRIKVFNTDCNSKLLELCESLNWGNNRAILFLDPYATEVKWETLRAIATTKAIDVWYLFPLSAATRLMKNDREIEPSWKAKLDMIFGDGGWYEEFYKEDPQISLFGDEEKFIKDVNAKALTKYICKRLETIFPAVAQNPRILYNTKNSPLFLFCFAVSNDNPKAIELALKGANHILNYRK